MTDLVELAERCEAATGPDRELDRCLFAVAHGVERERVTGPLDISYTASLDAAITLVPEGMGIIELRFNNSSRDGLWRAYLNVSPTADAVANGGDAATPALALCAAALRAQSESKQS
jgi:hypothetical protein